MDSSHTHFYQLRLKQGHSVFELDSDDIWFIARQMRRWASEVFPGVPNVVAMPLAASPVIADLPVTPSPVILPPPMEPQLVSVAASPPTIHLAIQTANLDAAHAAFPETQRVEALLEKQNATLMAQIEKLEAQLQLLSEQSQRQKQIPPQQVSENAFVDDEALSEFSDTSLVEDIESFVTPAHLEIVGTFDAFQSLQAEAGKHADLSFEQPVDKSTSTVENAPQISPEPLDMSDLSQDLTGFEQPVNNSVNNPPPLVDNSGSPPQQAVTPPSTEDDFDLLLDSLAMDLEGEDTAADTPRQSPPEVSREAISPEAEAEEEVTTPIDPPLTSVEPEPVSEPQREMPVPEADEPEAAFEEAASETTPSDEMSVTEAEADDNPTVLEDESAEAPPPLELPESLFDPPEPVEPIAAESAFPKYDATDEAPPPGIETFTELAQLAPQITGGVDLLALSAYFLSKVTQTPKFTLKDINAQLLRAGLTPVNHTNLEVSVESGYLELVPDMTGTANAAEYKMTPSGVRHTQGLLKS